MVLRLAAMAGLAASLFAAPSFAATAKQRQETCKFGADDQKLQGAARKSFMTKCLSNKDSPRGQPMPAPKAQ